MQDFRCFFYTTSNYSKTFGLSSARVWQIYVMISAVSRFILSLRH